MANARAPRALSDDELMQATALSDDELMQMMGGGQPKERTWGDFFRETVEDTIPQEVLATAGIVMGQGTYDQNRDYLERRRRARAAPGDDRSLQEQRQGAALNLYNNASFGYGPEIGAYIDTRVQGTDYDRNLEEARKIEERYRELEPDFSPTNLVSGGLGFVAGAPAGGALLKGAQGAIRGVRGAANLARTGKLAMGAPATTLGRVAETGAALGLTGAAAGEISATSNAPGTMAQRMATIGDDAGRLAMNAGLGAVVGVAAPALTRAGQRMANMLRNPRDKAARYLAERFLASGKTVDEFAADYEAAAASGKPIAPVDVAPQTVRDAGTAAARMPGKGRDDAMKFLQERQEAFGSRAADDMNKALGRPAGSFVQTADEIAAQRAEEAKPFYDKAFSGNKPVSGPKVVELTNRPSGKAAIQQGLKMAQDEGIPLEDLVIRDAKGNIVGYTMKALHYGKMALDDMIDSAVRSGNNQAARNLTTLKNQWLDEMDRISPDYAQGRKIFAGHSANQRALEMGRQATKAHPDQIKKDLDGLSKSEQEFYRQGYSQRIIEEIEGASDKGNVVNRIFGTKIKRDRMRAILGDEKYEELAQRYKLESDMYQTYADVNVGSQTAQRTAAQQDLNEGIAALSPEAAAGVGQSVRSGSIMPLLNAIGWQRFQALLNGVGMRTREQVVKLLFSNDPDEVRAGIALLNRHYAAAQRFNTLQEGVGAAAAANEGVRTRGGVAAASGAAGAASAAAPFVPGL